MQLPFGVDVLRALLIFLALRNVVVGFFFGLFRFNIIVEILLVVLLL